MNLTPKSEKVVRRSFLLVFLLTALVAGVGADKKSAPAAPRAAAPKAAPARAATTRPATTRPPTNRPATANRPGAVGTRPGTAAGTRPGAARTGAGTMNRNGNAGRTGTGTPMGRNGGTNAGRGGAGSVSRVNRPLPGRVVPLKGGGNVNVRPNGQIRSINRNGMHIEHGLNGNRRIESTHNGARVVTTGRNSGYVQRPYVTRGGRTYVSRTVVINHVAYARVYRSYSYGGHYYYGYHPAYYYGPAYYGWAYNPWPAPVAWGWGWGGSPWYGYYGGYFAPYPTYPSAAFWLTDYLIAANLQAAYAAQAAANAAAAGGAAASAGAGGGDQPADNSGGGDAPAASGGAVTLTPEIKAMIAEEVKAQLAAEQSQAAQPAAAGDQAGGSAGGQAAGQAGGSAPPQQASGEVPPALDPARRTFVVDTDLTVASDGQECTLTGGDVITRITDTPDDDQKVTVSVASSKKKDCAPGKQVAVAVDDLQEMHNHFQEQLDNGMKEMATKQGTGGLPKAPDTSTNASDVPPPAPDASAAKALDDQQAAADQTESQVVKEAFSQGS